MQQGTLRLAGKIFVMVLCVSGCAHHESVADLPEGRETARETRVSAAAPTQSSLPRVPPREPLPEQDSGPEEFIASLVSRGRATPECFQLRPGNGGGKQAKARRCEPQSLPFARCRSGIDSCRLGHENGPLTWFACEKARGNTSLTPRSGSILILAANTRRKMPTGHVAYVEQASPQGGTVYRLVFSHTNYDRRCSLETNIEATYDSAARTLDIHGGAWQAWGKGLPVAGFILE
ncbi:MAG: hypothetical protein D9V46_00095 [Deltaproteobacteria bacterium]|uniref:hypothetical protein n=1 Tax=Hydrosulfovibrio ferrireducens TaxID=2934181 RepID=UPI00122144DF|nr:MAG: hypothetical protein D9V46_00095 [Deltaproteobacteria bacterium]